MTAVRFSWNSGGDIMVRDSDGLPERISLTEAKDRYHNALVDAFTYERAGKRPAAVVAARWAQSLSTAIADSTQWSRASGGAG